MKIKAAQLVRDIAYDGRCTGCGTCAGVCPRSAIEMQVEQKRGIYLPIIDDNKCTLCGICTKVCPGNGVDYQQINLEIFGKEPEDIRLGNYLNCYSGFAADGNIRFNSSSGGLVTAILCAALEKGLIDGALVTKMRDDRPLEPQSFIARTKEEIIGASKSKYCPVPTNSALREIIESDKSEKIAVVGLPCHIQGLRKAEKINKILKEKIVLRLGLVCAHTDTFLMTDFVLRKNGINKANVTKIDYRGKGWPGGWTITLNESREVFIPWDRFVTWHNIWLSVPRGCGYCTDSVAELSDLSFGDLWLPEYRGDKDGLSLLISRTQIGEKLLADLVAERKVILNKLASTKALQATKRNLYSKKIGVAARMKLFRKDMVISGYILDTSFLDSIYAIYREFIDTILFSKPIVRKIVGFVPVKAARAFDVIPYVITNLQMKRLLNDKK
jgi:coenzyme F420 hydrogenase subunit beta